MHRAASTVLCLMIGAVMKLIMCLTCKMPCVRRIIMGFVGLCPPA